MYQNHSEPRGAGVNLRHRCEQRMLGSGAHQQIAPLVLNKEAFFPPLEACHPNAHMIGKRPLGHPHGVTPVHNVSGCEQAMALAIGVHGRKPQGFQVSWRGDLETAASAAHGKCIDLQGFASEVLFHLPPHWPEGMIDSVTGWTEIRHLRL